MIRLSLFIILALSIIACSSNSPTHKNVQKKGQQETTEEKQSTHHESENVADDDGMLSVLLALFDSEELVIAAADEELEPEDSISIDETCFDIDCSEITTQFTYLSNEYHASLSLENSDDDSLNSNDIWSRMRDGYALDLSGAHRRIEIQLQWYNITF